LFEAFTEYKQTRNKQTQLNDVDEEKDISQLLVVYTVEKKVQRSRLLNVTAKAYKEEQRKVFESRAKGS
jgi:hypothetical protein